MECDAIEVAMGELAKDRDQYLCVSPRHGLLLFSGGKAHQVELPPAETWPQLEAKVLAKGKTASATGG